MKFKNRDLLPSKATMRSFLEVLIWALLFIECADAIPEIVWEYKILGGGKIDGPGVRKGNGVVLSEDEKTVWTTSVDGSVRILSNDTTYFFQPQQIENRKMECRSSIALSHDEDGSVRFGVYAVMDIPDDETKITSRIILITSEGKRRWEVIVDGIVIGTPIISGDVVFTTHNACSQGDQQYIHGKFSVVDVKYGVTYEVPPQGAGGFGVVEKIAPFGPVAVDNSSNAYWAETWNFGASSFGMTYKFDGENITGLTRTSWSTKGAPVVSKDGSSMWFGGSGSSMHGWVHGREFHKTPSWSVDFTAASQDLRPMEDIIIVNTEESHVYGLTANKAIVCLNTTNGDLIWMNNGVEIKAHVLQLASDDSVLYAIGVSEVRGKIMMA